MAGGMDDHTGERDRRCRQLGGYAAGPEYGDFSGSKRDCIAEIRCGQIADTDFFGIPQVNGCAVGEMETGGHPDASDGLLRCHRSHSDHQGCGKRAGRGFNTPKALIQMGVPKSLYFLYTTSNLVCGGYGSAKSRR